MDEYTRGKLIDLAGVSSKVMLEKRIVLSVSILH